MITTLLLVLSLNPQPQPAPQVTLHHPKPVTAVVQSVPAPEPVKAPEPAPTPKPAPEPAPVVVRPPPSVIGGGNYNNTYAWGNCTWHVANRRAVPNTWGNARTWLSRAQGEGYLTGDTARTGAVVWFPPGLAGIGWLGHVAYVEAVNGDGTILISEMNVVGLGVASERTILANSVEYIY